MSTKESKNPKKVTILQKIRDSTEILFGAFSAELTKQTKAEELKKMYSFVIPM